MRKLYSFLCLLVAAVAWNIVQATQLKLKFSDPDAIYEVYENYYNPYGDPLIAQGAALSEQQFDVNANLIIIVNKGCHIDELKINGSHVDFDTEKYELTQTAVNYDYNNPWDSLSIWFNNAEFSDNDEIELITSGGVTKKTITLKYAPEDLYDGGCFNVDDSGNYQNYDQSGQMQLTASYKINVSWMNQTYEFSVYNETQQRDLDGSEAVANFGGWDFDILLDNINDGDVLAIKSPNYKEDLGSQTPDKDKFENWDSEGNPIYTFITDADCMEFYSGLNNYDVTKLDATWNEGKYEVTLKDGSYIFIQPKQGYAIVSVTDKNSNTLGSYSMGDERPCLSKTSYSRGMTFDVVYKVSKVDAKGNPIYTIIGPEGFDFSYYTISSVWDDASQSRKETKVENKAAILTSDYSDGKYTVTLDKNSLGMGGVFSLIKKVYDDRIFLVNNIKDRSGSQLAFNSTEGSYTFFPDSYTDGEDFTVDGEMAIYDREITIKVVNGSNKSRVFYQLTSLPETYFDGETPTANVKFSSSKQTITVGTHTSGKKFFQINVNGKEVKPVAETYELKGDELPANGSTVEIVQVDPESAIPVKVTVTPSDCADAIKAIYVGGLDGKFTDWENSEIEIFDGDSFAIDMWTNAYVVNDLQINGKSVSLDNGTYSLREFSEDDDLAGANEFTVKANVKLKPDNSITLVCDNLENLVVTGTYSGEELEVKETMSISPKDDYIIFTGKEGYYVQEVAYSISDSDGDTTDVKSYNGQQVAVINGTTYTVTVIEKPVRDQVAYLYLDGEAADWRSRSVTLKGGDGLDKQIITLEPGYNEITFNKKYDAPFAVYFQVEPDAISDGKVYMNGVRLNYDGENNTYDKYEDIIGSTEKVLEEGFSNMKDGDVAYIFAPETAVANLTYEFADEIAGKVKFSHYDRDHFENGVHTVAQDSEVVISLVDDPARLASDGPVTRMDAVKVSINGTPVEFDENGTYTHSVTANATIKAEPVYVTSYPVTFAFTNSDTNTFVSKVELDGEEVEDWAEGFDADENSEIVLTLDYANYYVDGITLNGTSIGDEITVDNGVGTYTVTVTSDALTFNFDVTEIPVVEVSFSFDNEDTETFITSVELDGEEVEDWAEGFDAKEGQVIILSLDFAGYVVNDITANDESILDKVNVEDGVGTYTYKVTDEPVEFSFDVRELAEVKVSFSFTDANATNVVKSVKVNGEEVSDWANGFEVEEGDSLEVTFDMTDSFEIEGIMLNGVSILNDLVDGVYTTTVGTEDLEFSLDATTGIWSLNAEELENAAIYTVNGVRINSVKNLQQGIYIINGRKVVVRK